MAKQHKESETLTDPATIPVVSNGKKASHPDLSQELTFDSLEPREFHFKLRSSATGEMEAFILQEPGASAGVRYQDKKSKAHIIRDNKLVGIDGINEADLDLLTHCVFKRIVLDGNREALEDVNPDYVRSWPYRVYAPLLTKLKEMCPELDGRDTLETIDKKIDALEKARAQLVGQDGEPKK